MSKPWNTLGNAFNIMFVRTLAVVPMSCANITGQFRGSTVHVLPFY